MDKLDIKILADDLLHDDMVAGLILAGSNAKKLQTEDSDLDVYIILDDQVSQQEIKKFISTTQKKYYGTNLDISNKAVQSISEFKKYALVGTDYEWDRYNLIHTELLFDKTDGVLTKFLKSKETSTDNEADMLIENNLGAYINLTYRSLQSLKAENRQLAKLDQAESVMYMLNVLFAFKKRVRPFNKYLAWELEKRPLKIQGMRESELFTLIRESSTGDNQDDQVKMYRIIERLASTRGDSPFFDAWDKKLDAIV